MDINEITGGAIEVSFHVLACFVRRGCALHVNSIFFIKKNVRSCDVIFSRTPCIIQCGSTGG